MTAIAKSYPRSEHQKRVMDFMIKAGQEVPENVKMPSEEVRLLRAQLLLEECLETIFEGYAVDVYFDVAPPSIPGQLPGGLTPIPQKGLVFRISERKPDLVLIADGHADVSVVNVGGLIACGMADQPILEEVDSSNLSKFTVPMCDTHKVPMKHIHEGRYYCVHSGECPTKQGPYRAATGKWIKGPDYRPADFRAVLINQGAEVCTDTLS